MAPRKRSIYRKLPGTVVEIGPGAGANFRYYKRGTRVIAVEPNVSMHPRLRKKARRRGLDLVIKSGPGRTDRYAGPKRFGSGRHPGSLHRG